MFSWKTFAVAASLLLGPVFAYETGVDFCDFNKELIQKGELRPLAAGPFQRLPTSSPLAARRSHARFFLRLLQAISPTPSRSTSPSTRSARSTSAARGQQP
jgi:hypothetical protein